MPQAHKDQVTGVVTTIFGDPKNDTKDFVKAVEDAGSEAGSDEGGQSGSLDPANAAGNVPPAGDAEDPAALEEAVGAKAADLLRAAGIGSLEAAKAAPVEQLLSVPGIGQATVDKLKG